jgi:hypothetical protein
VLILAVWLLAGFDFVRCGFQMAEIGLKMFNLIVNFIQYIKGLSFVKISVHKYDCGFQMAEW